MRLYSRDIEFIEYLCSLGDKILYDTTREPLKKTCRSVRSLIKELTGKGVVFTVDISLASIGLGKLLTLIKGYVGFEELPLKYWVNTYFGITSPYGVQVVYYYPLEHGYKFIQKQLERAFGNRVIATYNIIDVERAKPNLKKYYNPVTGEFKYNWAEWIEKIKEYTRNPKQPKRVTYRYKPQDWIDLYIVKELEKGALFTFKGLAEKLHVSTVTVTKHYELHVRGKIIRRVIPVLTKLYNSDKYRQYNTVMTCHDKRILYSIAKLLLELPITIAVAYTRDMKTIITQTAVPSKMLPEYLTLLREIEKQGITIERDYEITTAFYKRYTIPYTNYNPITGRWVKYAHETEEYHKRQETTRNLGRRVDTLIKKT